ncbi:MAG: hypothetical protein K2N72_06390, partial [Oscillospiraceae bacterium]|nr:hypothetical protein [Oscillospiraceae bacterium]
AAPQRGSGGGAPSDGTLQINAQRSKVTYAPPDSPNLKVEVTQSTVSHNRQKSKNRAAVQHRTCGECRAFMLPPVRAKYVTVRAKFTAISEQ